MILFNENPSQILITILIILTMSESKKQPIDAIIDSSHTFLMKLYNILSEKPGNVVISSISLEVILALSQAGARGKTADEILKGLQLPNKTKLIKDGCNTILTSLHNTGDVILEITNKLYCEQTFPLEREFRIVAEKTFLSDAENVDFLGNSVASRIAMNSWVEKKTHNKIKNLFEPNAINSDTKIVLISAIYFKGKWKSPFDSSYTSSEPFHISKTETKEVDMMHINEKFGYLVLEKLKAKMLVMPYVGEKLFMVILLPYEVGGLKEIEKKLYNVNIPELMKNSKEAQVEVSLPRFKIEKTIELVGPLKKLGMNSMFDPVLADFSGISKEKGLYVNQVVQKAFIEVNEEGTEAKAATGISLLAQSMTHKEEFLADKPFLFFLFETQKSLILFQGHYVGQDS